MLLAHDGALSELSKHWFLQVVSVTLQAFPRGVRTSNDSLKKDIGTKHQLPSARKLVSLSPALASSHPHIVNDPAPLHDWEDWLYFYKRPLCLNLAGIPWRGGRNGTSVPLCASQSFSSVGSWVRWYWMISDSFFSPSWCSPFTHTHCSVRKCSQSLLWLPYPPDH